MQLFDIIKYSMTGSGIRCHGLVQTEWSVFRSIDHSLFPALFSVHQAMRNNNCVTPS